MSWQPRVRHSAQIQTRTVRRAGVSCRFGHFMRACDRMPIGWHD